MTTASFSPRGRLVAAHAGPDVVVWETASGREIARFPYEGQVHRLAFSPNDRYVAAVGTAKQAFAQVWEVTTRRAVVSSDGAGYARGVAFTPDSRHVAMSANDRTLRIWETATGRQVTQIPGDETFSDVEFSPDGSRVAAVSDSRTARVWTWRPVDVMREACGRLLRNFTQAEWRQFIPNEPYRKTCPDLP
jgi:WD40 repeat protein